MWAELYPISRQFNITNKEQNGLFRLPDIIFKFKSAVLI